MEIGTLDLVLKAYRVQGKIRKQNGAWHISLVDGRDFGMLFVSNSLEAGLEAAALAVARVFDHEVFA